MSAGSEFQRDTALYSKDRCPATEPQAVAVALPYLVQLLNEKNIKSWDVRFLIFSRVFIMHR